MNIRGAILSNNNKIISKSEIDGEVDITSDSDRGYKTTHLIILKPMDKRIYGNNEEKRGKGIALM